MSRGYLCSGRDKMPHRGAGEGAGFSGNLGALPGCSEPWHIRGKLPAPCAANCCSLFLGTGRAPCAGWEGSAPATAHMACASRVWAPWQGAGSQDLPQEVALSISYPSSLSPRDHLELLPEPCGPMTLAPAWGPRTALTHTTVSSHLRVFAAPEWDLS